MIAPVITSCIQEPAWEAYEVRGEVVGGAPPLPEGATTSSGEDAVTSSGETATVSR